MDELNHGAAETPAPKTSVKGRGVYFFAGLGLLLVIIVGVFGFGVYRAYSKMADDKFTLTVAKILNLPAVKVNKNKVTYVQFVEDLKAIHKMRDYDNLQLEQGASPQRAPGANLTEELMNEQVLWRLVNTILVEEAAKEFNVTIEQKDVDELKAEMMNNFKDEVAANEELQKRYGWNFQQYEEKVMRPFILQEKLDAKIKNDDGLKSQVKDRAEKILQEIKSGADFAEMAKKYSEDSTAAGGGDLDWFGKGNMVPEFEKAAYSLRKGELYPTLVETQFGFHIIKLVDKKTEKVKNEAGKFVDVEKVRASHILFRFADSNKYLDSMVKKANIKLFLNVKNPFEGLKK
ncbi:MAG: peptidylprolyl isomerase [Patescibacteria group bacterium]